MDNGGKLALGEYFDSLYDLGWRVDLRNQSHYNVFEIKQACSKFRERVASFKNLRELVEKDRYLVSPSGIYYPLCVDKLEEPNSELDFEMFEDWEIANKVVYGINDLSFKERRNFYRNYLKKKKG